MTTYREHARLTASTRELGRMICKSLNLDPTEVVAIDFRWRPDEIPTVTVEMVCNESFVFELVKQIQS